MGVGGAMIIVEKRSGETGGFIQFNHFRQSAILPVKVPMQNLGYGLRKGLTLLIKNKK